jgi:hypothetical protein
MTGGGGMTEIVNTFEHDPALLFAVSTVCVDPATVGVPEMVSPESVSPRGKGSAENVMG